MGPGDQIIYNKDESIDVHSRGGGACFKDHRKSYGLEFIDIRREINAEMKQGGGKKSPKNLKTTKTGAPSGYKAGRAALRYIAPKARKDADDEDCSPMETSILTGGKNLRGSKS